MVNVYSKLCCARRRLNPDLAGRVLPITLQRYTRLFDQFTEFALTVEVPASFSEHEEIEFVIEEFRDTEQLSSTLHQRIVTSVDFFSHSSKAYLGAVGKQSKVVC